VTYLTQNQVMIVSYGMKWTWTEAIMGNSKSPPCSLFG